MKKFTLSIHHIRIIFLLPLKRLLSFGKIFKYDLPDKHRINALNEMYDKIICPQHIKVVITAR